MVLELPKQLNYEISKEKALSEINKLSLDNLAQNTGAVVKDGLLFFNFFNHKISFDFSSKELILPKALQSKSTEGLILHYLAYCKGIKPLNKWINFYQIKDATLYLPVFNRRTINIIQTKVKTADSFSEKCKILGGSFENFTSSAIAYKFYAFPYLPILIVYYEGDDDIPSEMKFMFDETASLNFPAEDVIVSSQFLSLSFLRI